MERLKQSIREVPDFPKPGILFYDITTLLADPEAFKLAVDTLIDRYKGKGIDVVLGVESRGFLFAPPIAMALGAKIAIVRKPGKLPYKTIEETYDLEYGTDTVQIHEDAIEKGQKVLIVDDLIATGGTVAAVSQLVKKIGGEVVECAFVIELDFLKGRAKLGDTPAFSLVHY